MGLFNIFNRNLLDTYKKEEKGYQKIFSEYCNKTPIDVFDKYYPSERFMSDFTRYTAIFHKIYADIIYPYGDNGDKYVQYTVFWLYVTCIHLAITPVIEKNIDHLIDVVDDREEFRKRLILYVEKASARFVEVMSPIIRKENLPEDVIDLVKLYAEELKGNSPLCGQTMERLLDSAQVHAKIWYENTVQR